MPVFNPFHWRRSTTEFEDFDIEARESCAACGAMLAGDSAYRELRVCGTCRRHYLFPAHLRIRSLVDRGSFRESNGKLFSADPLKFEDEVPYRDMIVRLQSEIRLSDALVTGRASIEGHMVQLAVLDFRFMGGSMGIVVGEKLVRAAEQAVKHRHPLIAIVASGGARMQEGMHSLLQMAKTAAAIEQFRESNQPFIAVLASPTTGGVFASFASLADFTLAEPSALVGFAGPRVVEELLGKPLPPESHSAEFLLARGLVDQIVDRGEQRSVLASILSCSTRAKKLEKFEKLPTTLPMDNGKLSPWELVGIARGADRPTALDYVPHLFDEWFEFHGDRQGSDDPAVFTALAKLGGRPVIVAAFERGHREMREARRFGRPMPSGYRRIQRAMRLAERLRLPVVTLVDTPGAYPGVEAEATGLAAEIANTLALASTLITPIVSVVTGEGGSGGALALAVADRVFIQQHAFFSVIAPEGAAAILYRDRHRAPELASKLQITPNDLLAAGIVDAILPESQPGSSPGIEFAAQRIRTIVAETLDSLGKADPAKLVDQRQQKYRKFGSNLLTSTPPAGAKEPRKELETTRARS